MKDVATRNMRCAGRFVGVTLGVLTVMGVDSTAAWSQAATSPAPASPAARAAAAAVEPGVDTSPTAGAIAAPASAPRSSTGDPAPADAATAPASAAAGGATPSRQAKPAAAAPRRSGRAMDRVELDASQITGNRELPRVLYIVPWRAPAAGEVEGRPVNSLLYELTKPVDRDVFRRENRYFDALQATATTPGDSPAGAPAASPGGPEK